MLLIHTDSSHSPLPRELLSVLSFMSSLRAGKKKMAVMLKIRGSLERCEPAPGREASGKPTGLSDAGQRRNSMLQLRGGKSCLYLCGS